MANCLNMPNGSKIPKHIQTYPATIKWVKNIHGHIHWFNTIQWFKHIQNISNDLKISKILNWEKHIQWFKNIQLFKHIPTYPMA